MAGQQKKRRTAPATTTIVEAARRLNIGRNQAYEAAHRGEIPTIRIGRRLASPHGRAGAPAERRAHHTMK